jgi:hypothetical protein
MVFRVRFVIEIGLDHRVGSERRHAGERLSLVTLEIHERERGRIAMLHSPSRTSILQVPQGRGRRHGADRPRPQTGVENGLPFLDLDGFAERFDTELIGHRTLSVPIRNAPRPGRRDPACGSG